MGWSSGNIIFVFVFLFYKVVGNETGHKTMLFLMFSQTFPRAIWIDRSGKQLIQWPVEEIEKLRENEVKLQNKNLKPSSVHEIQGITAAQVCTLCFKI